MAKGSPIGSESGDAESDHELADNQACKVCKHLEKLFVESDFKKNIGVFDFDVFEGCERHQPLFQWIEDRFYRYQSLMKSADPTRRNYDLMSFGLRREANGIPWIDALDNKSRPQRSYELLSSGVPGLGYQASLDSPWIDLSVVRQWIDRCQTQHQARCHRPATLPPVSPAWLIDTKDDCIVPGEAITHFIALSYRWGESSQKEMDSQTFAKFRTPGGLVKHAGLLAPTISDAIKTVRTIGGRYLWVDAVCLEPDNLAKLNEQLQLMGSIYACASLTIVALDGDARTGLLGTEARPRSLQNVFEWKKDIKILARNHPTVSALDVTASEYFRRGWTFQEYGLSRRRLIFAEGQIHWHCSCASWHEDCPDLDEEHDQNELAPSAMIPNIDAGWPDYKELDRLVTDYNARHLRYPEDAFPGITGLLTYTERAFNEGFLFGLPKASFDAALMWQCYFGKQMVGGPKMPGLRRRQVSAQTRSALPNAFLPSWSWIGWKGYPIVLLGDEAQYSITDLSISTSGRDIATIPITQWFCHSSPVADKKESIAPQLKTYDASEWKRTRYVPSQHGGENRVVCIPPPGVDGDYVYEHCNFPGRFYWKPLPCYIPQKPKSPNHVENRYISCQTKRLWLAAVTEDMGPKGVMYDAHLTLHDKHGRRCGSLQVPTDEQASKFPSAITTGSWRTPDGPILNKFPADEKLLELVAVCLRRFPKVNFKTQKADYDEHYGVLWVKWESGVAFRQGVGYVKKVLWDDLAPKPVDLVLG